MNRGTNESATGKYENYVYRGNNLSTIYLRKSPNIKKKCGKEGRKTAMEEEERPSAGAEEIRRRSTTRNNLSSMDESNHDDSSNDLSSATKKERTMMIKITKTSYF